MSQGLSLRHGRYGPHGPTVTQAPPVAGVAQVRRYALRNDAFSMTITDAERDRAVRALREQYANGALTFEEFDEQLHDVLAARSRDQLRDLMPLGELLLDPPSLALDSSVSSSDLDRIDRHLSTGERAYWVGRPDARVHLSRGDLFLVPFSILWASFAIFWEATAIASGAPVLFPLWGVPFVLVGLYMVAGRFFFAANRRRRTLYAVTNQRVLSLVQGRRGETVGAVYLSAIPNISTSTRSHVRGDVVFGSSSSVGGEWANKGLGWFTQGDNANATFGFYEIEDARAVADLVERLRDQPSQP
jgi:hypothetical protein